MLLAYALDGPQLKRWNHCTGSAQLIHCVRSITVGKPMSRTTTLPPGTARQLALEKLKYFESQCDELMAVLNDRKQFNSDEREHVQSLYRALKDELKAAAKNGTVSGKSDGLTDEERYFYKPAVQKAALALRPATNSDPIKSDWFSAVYDARLDLSHSRHNM
jgi:hypothetical protein